MENGTTNLGYLLNKAAKITRWDLNNKLTAIGLTASQWALIKDLSIQEEFQRPTQFLTPASIADRLNSDRPTVSGIIERLEKQQWVTRDMNPDDRRSYIIHLTNKAREQMQDLEDMSNATMQQAIAEFTDDEITALQEYLKRIINNF